MKLPQGWVTTLRQPQTMDSFIRFFLYVLIFWLPYSTAVIEVCVISAIILWLIKRTLVFNQKRQSHSRLSGRQCFFESYKPVDSPLNSRIYLFLFIGLLSVMGSPYWVDSLNGYINKLLEWFVVYFLIIEVFKEKKHILIFFSIFIITSLATMIDSIVQYHITYKDFFLGHQILPGMRATAAFKTPNDLGGYFTFVLPVAFALLFFRNRPYLKILSFLLLCLAVWSLIVTFTRGAWLAVIFGIIFMIYHCFYNFQKRKILLIFLVTVVIVFGFIKVFKMIDVSQEEFSLQNRPQSVNWRMEMWLRTIDMIKESPFLGHGVNTYMKIFQQYEIATRFDPTYAHNCYLQIAAEMGILGLASFLLIIVSLFMTVLKNIYRHINSNFNMEMLLVAFLSGAVSFLSQSFFDTNFYSLRLIIYFWYMVGIMMAMVKILETSGNCVVINSQLKS